MDFILSVHSFVRWLIVIVGFAAVMKFIIGWRTGGKFSSFDGTLVRIFTILIDVQVLIGLIYLVGDGIAGTGFPSYRIEHMITMIIAAVVAHLAARWKNAEDKKRFLNSFLVILDTFVVILIGILRLPG